MKVQRKHRNKNKTIEIIRKSSKELANKYLAQAIIYIEIAFILSLVVIIMIEALPNNHKGNTTHIERTLTREQFDTKSPIDIAFNKLVTTYDEYETLRNECNNYIKSNNIPVTSLETKVNIAEDTYIDTNGNKIINTKDDTMHETGPIYLKDKLIIRYINEKGEMKVVASKLNRVHSLVDSEMSNDQFNLYKSNLLDMETKQQKLDTLQGLLNNSSTISENSVSTEESETSIETVDINNLASIFNTQEITRFNSNISYDIQEITSNRTSEKEYLKDLSNIFLEVIGKSSDNIDETLKKKALQYFSYEGYTTIIEGIEYIDSNYTNIQVNFIEAGKSDLSIPYKDRVIMQVETSNDTYKVITNIIIKLNDSYKVFDIDII